MKLNKFTSLLLVALAISAVRCSKESAPATPAAPADAPKAASAPAAAPAPAVASAAAPKAGAPASMPVAPAMKPAPTMTATTAPMPATPAASAIAATGPDPRADLATFVPEMIRMLEAKDYISFLKSSMSPSDLAQMPAGMSPDILLAGVSQDPGFATEMDQVLQALKAIKDQTPTLDATGNKATYTLNPPIGDHKDLSFTKENGLWYPGL